MSTVADGRASFIAAAAALNEAGDKDLRREVYAGFRKIAKPLGEVVVKEASAELPQRGGFGAKVAAVKVGQSNATTGRNPGIALSFRTAPGAEGKSMDLKTVDEKGTIRHPTYGRRGLGQWRVTKVQPGAFRRPFEAHREPVIKETVVALERVNQQIVNRTNQGAR